MFQICTSGRVANTSIQKHKHKEEYVEIQFMLINNKSLIRIYYPLKYDNGTKNRHY